MSRATSDFLESANAANAAAQSAGGPAETVDIASVLAALEPEDVNDLATLASRLKLAVESVKPIVNGLARRGLVEFEGNSLKLSRAGERAVRYTSMTKF
jgi:hypothetical protein